MASEGKGDQVGYVVAAYLAVLLPWSILYLHDFISSKWKTVERTRRDGIRHLVIILLPLPYIVYYVVLQADSSTKDYKEMAMGITAIFFSLYHLLRTIFGLWHLHCFCHWATRTSRCLVSLGFEMKSFTNLPHEDRRYDSVKLSVEDLYINNSIIDNELFGGEGAQCGVFIAGRIAVQCRRMLRNAFFKHSRSTLFSGIRTPSLLKRLTNLWRVIQRAVFEIDNTSSCYQFAPWPVPLVTIEEIDWYMSDNVPEEERCRRRSGISFLGPRRLAYHEKGPLRLSLYPKNPERTWARWTVAFIAQRGKEWLESVSGECGSRMSEPDLVWSFAILQLTKRAEIVPNQWPSYDENKKEDMGHQSYFPLSQWGIFDREWPRTAGHGSWTSYSVKEVLLESCCESGHGLPYGWPIPILFLDGCAWYPRFDQVIKETTSFLRPVDAMIVEGLTSDHLFWLAAFLSVDHWQACDSDGTCLTKHKSRVIYYSHFNATTLQGTSKTLLTLQLGGSPNFDENPFVLPMTREHSTLSQNPSRVALGPDGLAGLPQVSNHIDNWLALYNGRNTEEFLGSFETATGYLELDNVIPNAFAGERQRQIVEFHCRLELEWRNSRNPWRRRRKRSRTRSASDMRFLGCVMLFVRENIDSWLLMQGRRGMEARAYPISTSPILVKPSRELHAELIAAKSIEDLGSYALESRILWECQCALATISTLAITSKEHVPSSAQAMALCVLGFPALVTAWVPSPDKENQSSAVDEGNFTLEHYSLQFKPVCPPQKICVQIDFGPVRDNALEHCMLLTVIPTDRESVTVFDWQDWKDVFEARVWKWYARNAGNHDLGECPGDITQHIEDWKIHPALAPLVGAHRARHMVWQDLKLRSKEQSSLRNSTADHQQSAVAD